MRMYPPLALVLAFTCFARADDGGIDGIGGNIKLLKGHRSIRMVSEYVHAELPSGRVRAEFVFHNDGPATNVKMGFPESGSGHDVDGSKSTFRYFRSYVDGARVRVKREGGSSESDGAYEAWWTKTVHFGRGQTRTVVNEYQGGIGADASNTHYFMYVLHTGASWKGSIGRAKIVVDATELGKVSDLHTDNEDCHRRGNVFTWNLRDLEPTEDDDIHLSWWDGFKDISVNDQEVGNVSPFNGQAYGNEPPRRVGNDVVLPLRAAATILKCELAIVDARTLKITGKVRSLSLTRGRRSMQSGERTFYFHRPVWVHRDTNGSSMMVELRPLVAALGGKTKWVRGALRVTMP